VHVPSVNVLENPKVQ